MGNGQYKTTPFVIKILKGDKTLEENIYKFIRWHNKKLRDKIELPNLFIYLFFKNYREKLSSVNLGEANNVALDAYVPCCLWHAILYLYYDDGVSSVSIIMACLRAKEMSKSKTRIMLRKRYRTFN